MYFKDRRHAGRQLAQALSHHAGAVGVVYPLPRGGVVLGVEVARVLGWPLDLVVPRKIGHPLSPEYAVAAVVEGGGLVGDPRELTELDPEWLAAAVARERVEARRRRDLYLHGRAPLPVGGKTALLVDDGIATGLTMQAAIREVRRHDPARVVVAVPVAPADVCARLTGEVDEFVTLDAPEHYLGAVGAYYETFPQVSDAEVCALLAEMKDVTGPPR